MNDQKLNKIDSNNNQFSLDLKKSSLVINKKSQSSHKFTPISSTSTVSSVSLASSNDNVSHTYEQQHINKKYQRSEKENHFKKTDDARVPQAINKGDVIKYGELVVLGYNGCINQPSRSDDPSKAIFSKRRKSKFMLQAKEKATGVKPSMQFNCHSKQDLNNAISKNENHSVTYTLSRTHQVIVQYVPDEKTDMFQIGRSTESAIDFNVLDTQAPQIQASATSNPEQQSSGQSTISRYACRIIVDREYPYTARIYAAGFDSSKRIFLGEKATKWKNEDESFDGVTTNGVLIMHPQNGFNYKSTNKFINEWMEVSVCGEVFNLEENRLTPCLGVKKPNKNPSNTKSNILQDGTLIDLCGATLLWRSTESLLSTPTKECIEMNLDYLNHLRPQCPVGFKTLVFPSSASPSSTSHLPASFLANNILINNNSVWSSKFGHHTRIVTEQNKKHNDRIPMVYLKCGHVHGQHDWGIKKDNERECPLCRNVGPYVELLIGIEPSFYCDLSLKTLTNNIHEPFKPYAFLPCGHMASETTCRYWSQIKVPQGVTQGLSSLCPFCAVPLCKEQPIVKIILQEGL